jgi:FAD/FMN-containing dehydrogenase
MISEIKSFGRYPLGNHKSLQNFNWISEIPDFSDEEKYLAYGLGKSYGDSCLNPQGNIISTSYMNRIISFDASNGILRVESGITLEKCIEFLIPRGWFLPVTPGTKLITVGGAVANDVHGKNHHIRGTFGCHITQFELLRSDNSRLICSKIENSDLFEATIGGLGLTGIITWVEFQCIKCNGPVIEMENIKFRSLDEFFEINEKSKGYEYTVSWLDTNSLSSGIYSRGNFAPSEFQLPYKINHSKLPFPFEIELINPLTVKIFNILYYSKQFNDFEHSYIDFEPFFYPLDAVFDWNKVYGKKGFLQYQFVIPLEYGSKYLEKILKTIVSIGNSSFLTVLKTFGSIKSPGLMSFPKEGITVAIDFRMTGKSILDKLEIADKIVKNCGGAIYPAKDARMSSENFKNFYPQWEIFSKFIDPKFSSGFWKRVMED